MIPTGHDCRNANVFQPILLTVESSPYNLTHPLISCVSGLVDNGLCELCSPLNDDLEPYASNTRENFDNIPSLQDARVVFNFEWLLNDRL